MINYLNCKDKTRRLFFVKKLKTITYLKAFLNDTRLKFKSRFLLKVCVEQRVLRLNNLSISKIRNRCTETGRPRFIITFLGLSRAQFKKRASSRFLFGLQKR